jgi:hypothetical protein
LSFLCLEDHRVILPWVDRCRFVCIDRHASKATRQLHVIPAFAYPAHRRRHRIHRVFHERPTWRYYYLLPVVIYRPTHWSDDAERLMRKVLKVRDLGWRGFERRSWSLSLNRRYRYSGLLVQGIGRLRVGRIGSF